MKIALIFATSLLGVVAACSSTSNSSQDKGLAGDGVGAASSASDTNPEGIPYPTDNIGTVPRKGEGAKATAGNRIANFKFLGYPNGNKSQGLRPLSLADYFDPSGTKYRLLHLQAAGVWCSACKAETTVVVPMKADLESRKAVWVVSVAEGPTPGTASNQQDVDFWMNQFKSPYTHFLDPNNAQLGRFYDRAALPWNANIDARTMEILTSTTGAVVTRADVIGEIEDAIGLADTKLEKPLK